MRVRVPYCIALAVGQEAHIVGNQFFHPCQDASVSIPICGVGAKLSPTRAGNTKSDVCVSNFRIDWEHSLPLVVGVIIV
jgi:hypothetical protein